MEIRITKGPLGATRKTGQPAGAGSGPMSDSLRHLRPRAVLPAPLRLLRLCHLHRPRPSDGGLRGRVPGRGAARRRRGGDGPGFVRLRRWWHALASCPRPPGRPPRGRAETSHCGSHDRVQPRGRRRPAPRRLSRCRGHQGLARGPVTRAPRPRRPRPSTWHGPGVRRRRPCCRGRLRQLESRPHPRCGRRVRRRLGRRPSPRCSRFRTRRPTSASTP